MPSCYCGSAIAATGLSVYLAALLMVWVDLVGSYLRKLGVKFAPNMSGRWWLPANSCRSLFLRGRSWSSQRVGGMRGGFIPGAGGERAGRGRGGSIQHRSYYCISYVCPIMQDRSVLQWSNVVLVL